jgi:succinylarginine dihydrolase
VKRDDVAYEVNFDGLVGPTHHYAGLAYGNVASEKHGGTVSNPRQAALQGLGKMKMLADLGVRQAVLPPQERPDVRLLRRLGFKGSDAEALWRARREAPLVLAAACSASSMWAANAATVSPAADTADGRTHLTAANLVSHLHRHIERDGTAAALKVIFADEACFAHHRALPAAVQLGDEGAANHTRLCQEYGGPGLEVFAYGRRAMGEGGRTPGRYPARQTLEASMAVARLHGLDPGRTLFVQQNPAAIDAGVFHNDVICVGNRDVLFYHRAAFAEGSKAVEAIRGAYARATGGELRCVGVTEEEVSVGEAVGSYLFNSQLVSLPEGKTALVCPQECREQERTRRVLERLVGGGSPIDAVHYVELRQSMQNGGGPACLRLRVVLTARELERMHQGVFLTGELFERLSDWVRRWYRERLGLDDLADPKLLEESRGALEELTKILGLGDFYPFQREG